MVQEGGGVIVRASLCLAAEVEIKRRKGVTNRSEY